MKKTAPKEGYRNRASRAMAWEFVLTHLQRTPLKSLLSIAPAVVFILALSFIHMLIANNEREADRLYTTIQINAELELADDMMMPYEGFIHRETVNYLQKSGYFRNMLVKLDERQNQSLWVGDEYALYDLRMRGIIHAESLPFRWKNAIFIYAPGWDASCFERSYDGQEERMPIFLSDVIMSQTELTLGDEAQLTDAGLASEGVFLPDGEPSIRVVIAGSFSIESGPADIMNDRSKDVLFPFSSIKCFDSLKGYTAAEFVIDPVYNRSLEEVNLGIWRTLIANHGNAELELLIWDEEIRAVIKPMERTLSLLRILYPVIAAAAAGVAVTMAYLMVLQDALSGAILRILGVDRRRALWIQAAKQWILCGIGLGVGLIASLVMMREMEVKNLLMLLLWAALYFIGCAAGTLFAGLSTTVRTPLYLLQTRE